MNFWTSFNSKNRSVADAWYDTDNRVVALICDTMKKPKDVL
jgi:hypothetical protein